jgi:hypothetical protein
VTADRAPGETGIWFPVFLPDGRRFLVHTAGAAGAGALQLAGLDAPTLTTVRNGVESGALIATRRRDGRELFLVSPVGAMMAVDVTTGGTFSAGVPRELLHQPVVTQTQGYDVTADGQRFLVPGARAPVDVPITVVMNWWVELARDRASR